MSQTTPSKFTLVRFFAKHHTKYLLSWSDAEPLVLKDLLALADEGQRRLWDNLSLGYPNLDGNPQLRREVAKLHGVQDSETLLTVPQEGIYISMKVVADFCFRKWPGQIFHAVVTNPGYQSLSENLKSHGCEVSMWNAKLQSDGWDFDINDLKATLKDNTRILVVNFPHNPTGFIPDVEYWERVIHICKENDIILFSDEIYRLTNNDGTAPYPSACSLYDNAITLFGLSKTFGLAGLRMAWLCSKNTEIMAALRVLKDYTTLCSPAPSEALSIIALQNREYLLNRTMKIIRANLDILDAFFTRYSRYFVWHRPKAGTTALVELKPELLSVFGGTATELSTRCREEGGILLLPSATYHVKDIYVRIGFGRASLPESLAQLEKWLNRNAIVPQ